MAMAIAIEEEQPSEEEQLSSPEENIALSKTLSRSGIKLGVGVFCCAVIILLVARIVRAYLDGPSFYFALV
jgi:hypothetical protein